MAATKAPGDEPERAVISRLAKLVDARILVVDPGGSLRMATATAPEDALWTRVDTSQEVVQECDAGGWHTVAMPIVTHAGERPSWLVVTSRRKAFVNQLTRPAAQATVPLLAAVARLGGVARDQERAIRGSLLEDVLKGRPATPAEARSLAARAATFGLNFEQPARADWKRSSTVASRPAMVPVSIRSSPAAPDLASIVPRTRLGDLRQSAARPKVWSSPARHVRTAR